MTPLRNFTTPREDDLGLRRISNLSGLSISVLPNGCVFAIEHQHERGRTLINQVHGSPLARRDRPPVPAGRPGETVGRGGGRSRREGQLRCRGRSLHLGRRDGRRAAPRLALAAPPSTTSGCGGWRWKTPRQQPLTCDAILVQDVGLGDRGFLMNNEAYASQYIDHHVARHAALRPGGDEPAEPGARHGASLDRARLPRGRPRLRHRRDAAARAGLSGRRPDRPRARSAGRAPAARGRLPDDPVAPPSPSSRADRRHGRSSAFTSPITPRRRATPISRGSTRSEQALGDFVPRPTSR